MENTPNTLKMGKDWSSCQELEILFGLNGPKLFILGLQLVILQVGVSLIPTGKLQSSMLFLDASAKYISVS